MAASAPQSIAFAIGRPITRAALPALCDRVCTLLERSGADVALCDVSGVDPDAVTVDALARLQLAARRQRCQVRLRHASSELLELVTFMGLVDVLPDVTLDGTERAREKAGATTEVGPGDRRAGRAAPC